MMSCRCGSSPLTRGTLDTFVLSNDRIRFIPAYAGNSLCTHTRELLLAVHPRLRGELSLRDPVDIMGIPVHPRLRGELPVTSSWRRGLGGSSPLTRGTRVTYRRLFRQRRFIPAYAGNSSHAYGQAVYKGGSSPLTRGTLINEYKNNGIVRFIPAYAGNSRRAKRRSIASAVHPRLRGELPLEVMIGSN